MICVPIPKYWRVKVKRDGFIETYRFENREQVLESIRLTWSQDPKSITIDEGGNMIRVFRKVEFDEDPDIVVSAKLCDSIYIRTMPTHM